MDVVDGSFCAYVESHEWHITKPGEGPESVGVLSRGFIVWLTVCCCERFAPYAWNR